MTRTRKILAWTFASLVVLLAVLVLIIAFYDWNRIKPPLNAKVSEELHRPFAINGNLAVIWQRQTDEGGWRAWVPWPHVVAEDLTLGNTDWSKQPQMATLKRVELRISPLALLVQRVVIPRIDLSEPNANLQRLPDGRANWTFKFDPKDPNAEPSNWVLDIGAIGFDKGHVTLDDQKLKTQLDLLIDPLGKPIPFSDIVGDKAAKKAVEKGGSPQDYAFALKVKGQYHGQNLAGEGKTGGLLALQDASRPFPLQAQMKVADTSVELAGTLTDPLHLGALDLRLKLAGASLGNLYPLIGVTLPDTPPYATDGHLIAKLHEPGGAVYRYEAFNGKIGESDIHGNLTYVASQPRPKLSGALES
ncbi:MAG: AsmA family protein, partial [Pseudomonas sp.]